MFVESLERQVYMPLTRQRYAIRRMSVLSSSSHPDAHMFMTRKVLKLN